MSSTTYDYDLFVIGTGVAGNLIAAKCNANSLSVAVADSRPFGGTCALRGCNPKKVLVSAAEVIHRSYALAGNGIDNGIHINWKELIEFKRKFTEPVPNQREKNYAEHGVDTYHGHVRFSGENQVIVDDETISAKNIVIATGATPRPLDMPGSQHIITSDQFLELESLPEDILFIGGGYISFELAHVAARAGSSVTILELLDMPLQQFDPDLVKMVMKASEDEGIQIHANTSISAIEKDGDTFWVHTINDDKDIDFETDLVVHGAGRVPNLFDLDLEKGNIETDEHGIILNEYLQSISNPSVYVAGDVVSNPKSLPLTPVAVHEGNVVVKNISGGNRITPNYIATPSVLFTSPQLATVGMTEDAAKEQGRNYSVTFTNTSETNSTQRLGFRYSAQNILVDEDNSEILGVHLLGHNVDEVINVFALAIRNNLRLEELRDAIWAFPSVMYNVGKTIT
jgi:glutathione reductase (NADPH)